MQSGLLGSYYVVASSDSAGPGGEKKVGGNGKTHVQMVSDSKNSLRQGWATLFPVGQIQSVEPLHPAHRAGVL